MYDLIIENANITDGSGAPSYQADLAIEKGQIAAIGDLKAEKSKRRIRAEGRYLTPGLIDMHSHADLELIRFPDAENLLGQGITTVFAGHCGMGMAPVGDYWKTQMDDLYAIEDFYPLGSIAGYPGVTPAVPSTAMRRAYEKYYGIPMDWTTFGDYMERLKKQGLGVNLVEEAGLQQIRQTVLGQDIDRPATPEEIEQMKQLVAEAMEHGARGLSIGYDYTPDMYASTEELEALIREAGRCGGIITAHTRTDHPDREDWTFADGIREFLDICLRCGVHAHISHICPNHLAGDYSQEEVDTSAEEILQLLEEYRGRAAAQGSSLKITWDVLHPEAASFYFNPDLAAPFQYYILTCGGKQQFSRRLQEPAYRSSFLQRIRQKKHLTFPRIETAAVITSCSRTDLVGKSIDAIAGERGCDACEVIADLLALDIETRVRTAMPWERLCNTDVYWKREEAAIGTDNGAVNYDFEGRRPELPSFRMPPSAYCGFILFLQQAMEKGMSFEAAIRRLTGNAADILGLTDRGRIAVGAQADLVLWDLEQLDPCRSFIDPRQRPKGPELVLVNGQIAVEKGRHTHGRSGQLLTQTTGAESVRHVNLREEEA